MGEQQSFHLSAKGELAPCRARKKACPRKTPHFASQAEGEAYLEAAFPATPLHRKGQASLIIPLVGKERSKRWQALLQAHPGSFLSGLEEAWDEEDGSFLRFNKNEFALPRETVAAFRDGDCWALALALQEQEGWPVFVVAASQDCQNPRPSLFFDHMVVREPQSGRFLDVNGLHSEEELFEAGWGSNLPEPCLFEVADALVLEQARGRFFPAFDAEATARKLVEKLTA